MHVGAFGYLAVGAGVACGALHEEEGIVVAVYGMPSGEQNDGTRSADRTARRLAERYRDAGPRAIETLSGHFSAALWDERNSRLVLAVDRLGVQQLFVSREADRISFATSAQLLSSLGIGDVPLSAQGVYDYVYFHVVPSPQSVFEGIERLEPGESLEWNRGQVERRRYWQPAFTERRAYRYDDLRREFVGVLEACVADAQAGARCGAFLSGGTDSSTIAGLMRRSAAVTHTYSIGFEADGYDEMEYARIAARHFDTAHQEYYVTPDDVVAAIPELARIHDQPFGNASAVPAFYCARMAADDGIERMIGGDGGDELFGGNARYATQRIFSHYERIPRPLRRLIEPAARQLPRRIAPLRKVRSYVEQASVPMPARTETYNLLHRLGHRTVFRDEFLAQVDTGQPLALQERAYFNPTAGTLINRQLALDMKFTLADNDVRKVVRSCELAELPVAFPFLDPRIVDFALRLPPELKLRGTQLRYFFKRALAGFLPEAIIRKRKHGFGLPFGVWAVSHSRLRAIAFDSVSDLAGRGIFRSEFLARLPGQLADHPGYYGQWIWVLMMLEQWLKHHAPATRWP